MMKATISTIYVLGNPLVASDSLPLKMLGDLRAAFPKVDFVEADPSEDLPEGRLLIFLDTALDISKVVVLDDIDRIAEEPSYSLHQFGLGTHLKMLRKLGRAVKVKMICVPMTLGYDDAVRQVKSAIRGL